MLYIAVCDDEKYYRERIKLILMRYLDQRQIEYNIRPMQAVHQPLRDIRAIIVNTSIIPKQFLVQERKFNLIKNFDVYRRL